MLTGDGSLRIDNQDFIVGKVVEVIDEVVDFVNDGSTEPVPADPECDETHLNILRNEISCLFLQSRSLTYLNSFQNVPTISH